MELADLAKLMKSRRSIRRWQDRDVPRELLTQAVELATWAPNGGNQQNWRFYVILDRDVIRSIARAVQTSADQIASWPESEKYSEVASWRQRASFFRDAPAAVAVAAGQYQSVADLVLADRAKTDPEAAKIRQSRNAANSRIQSVAAAISYLLLVLHQMGLGAVWMTGPIQAKTQIEKALGVPSDMDIVAFIPVGYPAESPAKDRLPVEKVCRVIG